MKYIGEFRNIDNVLYRVEIVTNNNDTMSRDIVLSDTPFSTDMDTADENIYTPIRCQGATVSVVTRTATDYMFDVYSGSAKGTKVNLYSNNQLVWGGYASPVIYNNGYTSIHEELEIEAVDGLSILKNYKYNAPNKQITSFVNIINKILSVCEVYTGFYISSANKLTSGDNTSLIENLYISEQNFFDEKEDNETDDDVAWTCHDVLEQICQYLGLVCVGWGEKVYFLDYDAINAGYNGYWYYALGSNSGTQTVLENSVAVEGKLYRGGSSNISLDNVYNKVTVTDDFYEFEDIIPDIYSTAENITKSSDPTLASSTHIENGMYGEVVQGVEGNQPGDANNNMICMIDRVYDPEKGHYTDYNVVFVKYFKHPKYRFYSYSGSSSSLNYTDTKTFSGAFIGKYFVKQLEETFTPSWWELITGNITSHTLDEWMAKNQISSLNFDNYIVMLNQNNFNNSNIEQYPYFETTTSDTTALFGGENAYLVITGKYIYHYINEDPYPIPDSEVDISEGRYAMRAGQTYLVAKLQWGDKYWNGDDWVSGSTTFQIPYMRDDSSDSSRRADATMFKKLDFINTVTWRIGTSEKGHLIKLPQGKVMSGLPKLTVYKPISPEYFSTKSGDSYGQHYKHSVVFLKDFAIKAIIGDPTYSDVNDSDTVYTNIIDNNYAQEMDEIEFKICTNDNKNPNYSSVAYMEDNEYKFVTGIHNDAMANNGVVDHAGHTSDGRLRPEEWMIYRLVNQYSEPKIRLELQLKNRYMPYTTFTDKWVNGKHFVVDSQTTDFYNGQTTITLVEKA